MSVTLAAELYTYGLGTTGFTFSVLDNTVGSELKRDQGENPLFLKDYNNADFVPDVVYSFLMSHPVLMPDPLMPRMRFDAFGGVHPIDANPGAPGSGSSDVYPPALMKPGDDIADGQLVKWVYDATTNSFVLGNLLSIPAATWQRVMEAGATSTVSPTLLGSLQTGDPNLIFQHTGTSTSGLIFKNLLAQFRAFLGLDADGQFFFLQGANRIFEFAKSQTNFFMDLLAAINTHAVFQRVSTSVLPIASTVTAATVWEHDPVTGRNQIKGRSLPDLINTDLFQYVDATKWINLFRPLLTGEQVANDYRIIDNVWCEDIIEEVVVLTEHFVPITADMIGTPQAHPFNRDGSLIWADLKDYNNKADEVMDLSFPTPTTFQIDYPEGASDYAGGKLLLKI